MNAPYTEISIRREVHPENGLGRAQDDETARIGGIGSGLFERRSLTDEGTNSCQSLSRFWKHRSTGRIAVKQSLSNMEFRVNAPPVVPLQRNEWCRRACPPLRPRTRSRGGQRR